MGPWKALLAGLGPGELQPALTRCTVLFGLTSVHMASLMLHLRPPRRFVGLFGVGTRAVCTDQKVPTRRTRAQGEADFYQLWPNPAYSHIYVVLSGLNLPGLPKGVDARVLYVGS